MEPMRILQTKRLILRRLMPDDLDDLFELYRDPENQASVRVARNIGMTLEKEMRDEQEPSLLYSMSRPRGLAPLKT